MKNVSLICALIFLFSVSLFAQGTTQYVYDANGRLTHVISAGGQVSVYEYDFAGNLTRIRNEQNPILLISNFSPQSGNVGTTVSIRGVGFDLETAQNQVKFNGLNAVVLTATATELTVTVPIGATTGKIHISNSIGTVTSSANFSVLDGIPVITFFSPTLGKSGDPVNITGSGFSSQSDENIVRFNKKNATIISSDSTDINTIVPTAGTSGKISVATDFGESISNDDFYIVPNGYEVADVSQTARLNYAQVYSVNIPAPKKLSLFVFEGTAGSRIHLNLANITAYIGVEIKSPNNVSVLEYTTNNNDFLDNIELPENGTYSLSVFSYSTASQNLELSLYQAVADVDDTILTDGTPKTININTIGQKAKLHFSTGPQTLVLTATKTTISDYSIELYTENGQYQGSYGSPAILLDLQGSYYILIDPAGINTGSATLTLEPIPPISETIETDGTSKQIDFYIPGQNAELTFSAIAGQNFGLRISNVSAKPAAFSVISPSGQTIYSDYIDYYFTGAQGSFATNETGTYKIFYDPQYSATGSATFALNLLIEATGDLVINDPPETFTSTLAGQSFRLSFAGNSGQRFYLRSQTTDFYYLYLTIKNPDGSDLITDVRFSNENDIDINNLPDTGTYTLLITPAFSHQFGDLQLQAIDTDVPIVNNSNKVINAYFTELFLGGLTKKTNQTSNKFFVLPTAVYTLNGTSGEQFSLTTGGQPPTSFKKSNLTSNLVNGNMTIFKPDGEILSSTSIDTGFCNLTLPENGLYRIEISPEVRIVDAKLSLTSTALNFELRTTCGFPQNFNSNKNKGVKK